MHTVFKSALLALSIAALLRPAPAAANLLSNGSFEATPPLSNAAEGFGRDQLPTGWSGVSGIDKPDILTNAYTQVGAGIGQLLGAKDGNVYLDTNGTSPTGAIFQDVTGLTAGANLALSFWSGSFAQNSAGSITATLLDGATQDLLASLVVSYPQNRGATSSSWTQSFLAATVPLSGSLRVRFDGDSGDNRFAAPALDDVVLAASVPEPVSGALLGIGLVALASLRQRRRTAPAA